MKRKYPATIYLTEQINNTINKLVKNDIAGSSKNTIIINCILVGLQKVYNIEI